MMAWTSIEGICERKGWIMVNTFLSPSVSLGFPHSLASWRGAGVFSFLGWENEGKLMDLGVLFFV